MIALGIIVLLVLILFIRVKVIFMYYGTELTLQYKVLFLKFEQGIFDFKDINKYSSSQKHLQKKKKRKPKSDKKEAKKPKASIGLKESLILLRDGVFDFWKKFRRYARLEKYILKINLATDDPAKTAVLYGSLSGIVGALHVFASSIKNRARKAEVFTEYKPDFYADRTDAAVEIGFSMQIWQLLSCMLIAAKQYIKYRKLQKSKKNKTKGDSKDERLVS